jgi:pyruvate/2-oxoglutarate/acetoin dehydrogenase E1 component
MREVTYINAMNEALAEEMERDKNVFIIGEDVDINGGVWKETDGLLEKFGSSRIIGTPISEAAFSGLAAGAAMCGLRPVLEFMYMDFAGVAMDQLCNQIAKLNLMSGGQIKIPITIRMCGTGTGTREGAQHSQSLEAWFAHVPGFKVVMPATAKDAKGLLKSSIRDDSPVIFIENRNLYYDKEQIPDGDYTIPIGEGEIVQTGSDITVIAIGYARRKVITALKTLDKSISVELIDPRTVDPLDMNLILSSLAKTGKMLIVHEAAAECGIGAEIVRRTVAEGFDYLDSPPIVLGGKNIPTPFSPKLEDFVVPSVEEIATNILALTRNQI